MHGYRIYVSRFIRIVEKKCAEYGKQLLQYLADKLMEEFGKGFTVRNLQMMRQFHLTFPNANALRSVLS